MSCARDTAKSLLARTILQTQLMRKSGSQQFSAQLVEADPSTQVTEYHPPPSAFISITTATKGLFSRVLSSCTIARRFRREIGDFYGIVIVTACSPGAWLLTRAPKAWVQGGRDDWCANTACRVGDSKAKLPREPLVRQRRVQNGHRLSLAPKYSTLRSLRPIPALAIPTLLSSRCSATCLYPIVIL
jgi:hypothetical protein